MWLHKPDFIFCFKPFVIICALGDLLLSDWHGVRAESDVDMHLEMGKKLLAAGQLADALSHYHAAVEGNPLNPMTFYRRATVYMAIGKSKSALPDFDKALELKSDFTPAYVARGNIYLKQGDVGQAKQNYRRALELEPENADAQKGMQLLAPLAENIENAKNMYENGMYADAVHFLNLAIEVAPFHVELREMRAECYEQGGQYQKAANDLRSCTKLVNDNTDGLLKLSLLLYKMGDVDQSLNEIRQCLRLDPDHKKCKKHYTKVKKLAKQLNKAQQYSNEQNWERCVSSLRAALKTESQMKEITQRVDDLSCKCRAKGGLEEAIETCTRALEHDNKNADLLCNRAEAHINQEQYQEAIKDYQVVLESDKQHQRAREGMQRAQKLLKNSNRRDYYKILGVSKTANKRDILRAFRKLAAKYHPDHYQGEDKKRAQRKYLDLGDAKDVLTDPEKRSKFDQGEDPLDPEQQQRSGGHPFGHHPFGDFSQFFQGGGPGGFQFKFKFG